MSRHELLPLQQLKWEVFESFCCELLTLLKPDFTFEHYGKQGDKQRGIDLIGRGEDGSLRVAQCKKVDRFAPADARAVVAAMAFQADKYLLLMSSEATTGVRDVILNTPYWELWDVRDISRRARRLPPETAQQLVENYFGLAWCEVFLGHMGSAGLLTPEEYFARLLDETQLFHQAWPLMGQEKLLDELDGLLGGTYDAALLCGRGGIGKTKLLYEWSKRARSCTPETHILFFEPHLVENGALATGLPAGPCVLVVDDAHAAGNLDPLLALVHSRPRLKVLLTCRPQADGELRSRLYRADFDLRKTLHLEVPQLSEAEVLALAQQGLGEERSHLAGRLAAITVDSPLATVVGARLISERGLDPRLLSSDKDFKAQLFRRFEEIILGEVSARVEPRFCRQLLQLLSALSPFDLEDAFLPKQAWEFLGADEETFRKALDALVEAGALLRTGNHLRITPDLLSEHLFQEACVTLGQSTGYAEKVFEQFAGICPETLASNLAVLGWRLRETREEPPGFLKGPWGRTKHILQTGANHDRRFALRLVIAAAYHEPRRALECVEALLHALYAQRTETTQPLPPEIQEQAFTVLWLVLEASEPPVAHRCLDLMWQVGRDDPRPLGWEQMTDHGVVVLSRIARYHPHKSDARYGLVLDAFERWLEEPDALEHPHTPLPILDALLRKQINLVLKEGDRGMSESFFADAAQMGSIRGRALALVGRCARAGSPRAVQAAADCLGQALRHPRSMHAEDPQGTGQWIPEQLQIIELLEQLASELPEPLCHQLLVNALYPAIIEKMEPRVFARALAFISSVPDVFELRLVRALKHNSLVDSRLDTVDEVSVRWPPTKDLLPGIEKEFRERFPDPAAGYAHLQERISTIAQFKRGSASPGDFLKTIAQANPLYAQCFCEHALAQESTSLDDFLPGMLGVLREQSFRWFLPTLRRLVASGAPRLRDLAARSYASVGMAAMASNEVLKLEDEELRTLRMLIADEQLETRSAAVFWLYVLEPARDSWLVEALAELDIKADTALASNLCRVLKTLHARNGIPPEHLDMFLSKLLPIRSLPLGSIQQFLADVSAGRAAPQVFEFVLSRIQHLETGTPADFEPFPQERDPDFPRLLGSDEHATSHLQAVLAKYPGATVAQRRWLAMLFNALSSDCGSSESIALLQEQARTGDASTLDAVASVLSHAPVDFVLDKFELTRRLVERSSTLGETCARDFMHRLLRRAALGAREGDGRTSVPQGEQRLERALRCRIGLPLGSRAYPFYARLCEKLEELQPPRNWPSRAS
ncbi:hypothetical protein SAMN04488504_105474 [Myxococcus virescens]|nr:hypothetical protein SAMN04488504_105474 [Myxococcus virescens]